MTFGLTFDTAQKLAGAHGWAQECTHLNAEHEPISTRFIQVVNVTETLSEDLDDDAVDLYSRHFRNIDSYRAFEALLTGEPL